MLKLESTIHGTTRVDSFSTSETVWIGRSSKCQLHIGLDQSDVSRKHAQLRWSHGEWRVEDHSRIGTLLNGIRLPRAQATALKRFDELRVGPLCIRVADLAEPARPRLPALTLTPVDMASLDPKVVLHSALELPRLFGGAGDETAIMRQGCEYLVKVLGPVIDAAYVVEGSGQARAPQVLARCSIRDAKAPVLSRRIITEVSRNPESVVFFDQGSDGGLQATVEASTRAVGACLIEHAPDGAPVVMYVVGTRRVQQGQELAAGYLRLVSTLISQHVVALRRSNMAKYFSPRVVELLMRRGGLERAEGEPRLVQATSLFFDLRGFSVSAEISAADLLPLQRDLRRAMDIVTHEVFEGDGTVIDYQGDGCFAAWGVPFDQADQAVAAVDAALRILSGLRQTRLANLQAQRGALCGIGIARGEVLAGSVGSSEHYKYGLLGPSVNRAARLEALTKPARLNAPLLTTADIVGELDHSRVPFVRAGRVRLEGIAEPLDVFELLTGERVLTSPDASALWHSLLSRLEAARTVAELQQIRREVPTSHSQDDPRWRWLLAMLDRLESGNRVTGWDGLLRYEK